MSNESKSAIAIVTESVHSAERWRPWVVMCYTKCKCGDANCYRNESLRYAFWRKYNADKDGWKDRLSAGDGKDVHAVAFTTEEHATNFVKAVIEGQIGWPDRECYEEVYGGGKSAETVAALKRASVVLTCSLHTFKLVKVADK